MHPKKPDGEMFNPSDPIDDTLLALVKRVKATVGSNPEITWVADRETWLLTINDWISDIVFISYLIVSKKHYCVFIRLKTNEPSDYNPYETMLSGLNDTGIIGDFFELQEVITCLILLKFRDNGISDDIIAYLAQKLKTASLQDAVNSISTDTNFIIEPYQIEVMNIDRKQRGKITGRNFGLS